MYLQGAIANAELVKIVYPGWTMMVWHDNSIPSEVLSELTKHGVVLRNATTLGVANGMLWRFLSLDESGMEAFLSRDCDSRLNEREAAAVTEWLDSGVGAHVMRDHPHHDQIMMGGMWGCKAGVLPNMRRLITPFENKSGYGHDQVFLASVVWPIIRNNCVQHCFGDLLSVFPYSQPFPTKSGFRFVGEVFDEKGNPRPQDWEMRINWLYD